MDDLSSSDILPSLDELSVQVEPSPPLPPQRAKSPPLAFQKTSNDSLAPLSSPPVDNAPSLSPMGRLSPLEEEGGLHLQVVVDQQASAIQLLHDAFAAERQSWALERDRLYQRIASLERLLRNADGYSPAKSPVASPSNGSITSPQHRPSTGSQRLPSIAEDENLPPLSQRRANAPQNINITGATASLTQNPRSGSVSFAEATPTSVKVEEIPGRAATLSPPPFPYRMEAGHTPLRPPHPPTPPPNNSLTYDGIEDTPTRHNTAVNTMLSRSSSEDEDPALKGPLNMPELPHQPDESNFTLDMLSKRLEQIEQHPEERDSRPGVFKQPSPGLASPASEREEKLSPKSLAKIKTSDNEEDPVAPAPTHNPSTAPPSGALGPIGSDRHISISEISSQAMSPLSKHSSREPDREREERVQADFESGGIKLKKKPSVNFGVPFGQLGGFGNIRKQS